jgi:hypothetical protein
VAVALLVALTLGSSALAGGGNSVNAKLCQKNGWTTLVTAEGVGFSDQSACVSYGAGGGVLVACTEMGTPGADVFYTDVSVGGVLCGLGGNDNLAAGLYGTFYGGPGNDFATSAAAGGTFNGGDGNDGTFYNFGTFTGGAGDDFAYYGTEGTFNGDGGNDRTDTVAVGGTFNGGEGNDLVAVGVGTGGTFNGGGGDDTVQSIYMGVITGGTFNGGDGNDLAGIVQPGGTFDGGANTDTLCNSQAGATVLNVEIFGCG